MTQEEIDALETSFRNQGFTWNQTNFAVAVIRNYVEPLRQQLAEANHANEFMSQQYLDALKERNQLRKDVAKVQEALTVN